MTYPYEICPISTCVSDDFSGIAVIAFDIATKKAFLAQTFKSVEKAQAYVKDLRRYEVSYDFIIGDYTYRRNKNA